MVPTDSEDRKDGSSFQTQKCIFPLKNVKEQHHMVPSRVFLHYQGPIFPVHSSQSSPLTHVNSQIRHVFLALGRETPNCGNWPEWLCWGRWKWLQRVLLFSEELDNLSGCKNHVSLDWDYLQTSMNSFIGSAARQYHRRKAQFSQLVLKWRPVLQLFLVVGTELWTTGATPAHLVEEVC